MYEQEEEQPEIVPYQNIGEAYRWLADMGFNPEAIYSYVSERAGTSLPVSWPDGILVRLVDMTRYTYFLKRYGGLCEEGKYVCCGERMVPFGRLRGRGLDTTRFVMLFGATGGVYCYDGHEDVVFHLGDSLVSFFQDGLRRLDPIFATSLVEPIILVDGVIASLLEAESVPAFISIVAENQGAVYQMVGNIAGIDAQMMLYRGDYGTVTSCSLGTVINLTSVMCSVVRRFSSTFDIFAVVGYKAATSVFRPRLILIIDPFGAIFGYDNCLNRVTRLADSFHMFIRIGSRKSLLNFRHDKGFRGIGRLEKIPYCPHVGNVRELPPPPPPPPPQVGEGQVVLQRRVSVSDEDPQYVVRDPDSSFCMSRMTSFGEQIGHDLFLGRKNKFFHADRINRNQCVEGFVADVFSHYDAANIMRAAYFGFKQITDLLWPEEIEGLLVGHPSCPAMASDPVIKTTLEGMRSVMRSVDDDSDDDCDTSLTTIGINDPPCRRCIERRRVKLFKMTRGYR
ncbi:M36 protein [Murid betaherpesvirus 1]|nr:M36 protein [Murid betaherpesvirus 1]AWV68294.1 M36 protein [Murid betaherpesvirus 1]